MARTIIFLSNGEKAFINVSFDEFEEKYLDAEGNFVVPALRIKNEFDRRSVIFTNQIASIEEEK